MAGKIFSRNSDDAPPKAEGEAPPDAAVSNLSADASLDAALGAFGDKKATIVENFLDRLSEVANSGGSVTLRLQYNAAGPVAASIGSSIHGVGKPLTIVTAPQGEPGASDGEAE